MSTEDGTAVRAAHGSDQEAPRHERSTAPQKATRTPMYLDPQNVLLFLIGLRLVNALTIQTFFQPDEYFQALEPALQWAFTEDAGTWMTWVRETKTGTRQ